MGLDRDEQAMLHWLTGGQSVREARPQASRGERGPTRSSALAERSLGSGADGELGATRQQAAQWEEHGFTPIDVAAWQKVGLRADESNLAAELRDVGISPAIAALLVRRENTIDRIRRGLSARQIHDMLIREGLLSYENK
jgi:hypothetical protein